MDFPSLLSYFETSQSLPVNKKKNFPAVISPAFEVARSYEEFVHARQVASVQRAVALSNEVSCTNPNSGGSQTSKRVFLLLQALVNVRISGSVGAIDPSPSDADTVIQTIEAFNAIDPSVIEISPILQQNRRSCEYLSQLRSFFEAENWDGLYKLSARILSNADLLVERRPTGDQVEEGRREQHGITEGTSDRLPLTTMHRTLFAESSRSGYSNGFEVSGKRRNLLNAVAAICVAEVQLAHDHAGSVPSQSFCSP